MSKEVKSMVPALRFPEYRDSGKWELTPLKKLAKRCTEKNREGRIVRVLTNSAEHGIVDQRDYFDKDIAIQGNLEGYFIVEKGDFVYNPRISSMAPVGPISKNNIATGVMSPLYTVFRFNFKNDDFYAHFFKTTGWHQYMQQVSSTGARHDRMAISKNDFTSMPLPISPVEEEQQKIADCLSSLDELITAHTQKHQALQSYKKGLLQNLFPAEGETAPALRFPEFKDSEVWKSKKIERLAKRGSGHTPNKKKSEYYNGGVKWVSLADSKRLDNGYIYDTSVEISSEGIKNSSAVLHPAGSVIVSRDAGVGKSAVLYSDMAVSQHFIAWYCNGEKLSNWFLYYYLQLMKPILEGIAVGNTIKTIGLPFFKELCLTIPSIEEQKRIAGCLRSVDDLISSQAQKIEDLKAHKKGLMQQLFPIMDEAAK